MKLSPLFIIILLRLVSALPFAIYYSSLQLYLLGAHFSQELSASLVGNVLALSFGSALFGGWLGNKYINYKSFLVFCILCETLGCFTFATYEYQMILWFSSLFILGSSGINISINMLVTQRFEALDSSREKSFFWLYMTLNLGYLIGYSISGYYGNFNAYQNIAYAAVIFSLIACVVILMNWKSIDVDEKHTLAQRALFILWTTIFLCVTNVLLRFSYITSLVIVLAWFVAAVWMFRQLLIRYVAQRQEVLTFYLLIISALIFWSAYFLAPLALIVFVKHQVNLVLYNVSLAPQWIQNINTIVVIVGTIILSTKVKLLDAEVIVAKFLMGLLLMGFGFGVLAFGIMLTHSPHKVALIWVVISYFFQSFGELTIGPIGYALVGRLIPKQSQSIMMGVWITLLGIATIISSKLSILVPYTDSMASNILDKYEYFFFGIFFVIIVLVLALFSLGKKIAR